MALTWQHRDSQVHCFVRGFFPWLDLQSGQDHSAGSKNWFSQGMTMTMMMMMITMLVMKMTVMTFYNDNDDDIDEDDDDDDFLRF